jgi:hypothetical protein
LKVAFVLITPVVMAIIGYRVGEWWLHRMIQAPELETAVYPGIGTLIGIVFGVILGALLASLWGRTHPHE